jgi:hypothetical protein
MRPYGALMSPRKLFVICIALAVLLAPAFGRAGEAFAAVPGDRHMEKAEGGHCQSPPADPAEHGKAAKTSCCVSMCIGVAVTPPPFVKSIVAAGGPVTFGIASLHLGYLGEIATPPPKFA